MDGLFRSQNPAGLVPAAARALFRAGTRPGTTSGWCHGHVQANMLAVPRDLAFDALLFAWRNPRACPLIDVTDPGDPCPRTAAPHADLRTDLPAYVVYRDGEPVATLEDAVPAWREDMVGLLTGCSFTAEDALLAAGIPLRHLEQDRNVPMYVTNRRCAPTRRLSGPLVVSMRFVPRDLVGAAAEVTGALPLAHGGPVHAGDPAALGIADLDKPDFGDAVRPRDGDVPVFWACGVTLQAVIMSSRPEYAVTHAPGRMFITDLAS
ncbi:putative hydro-lyase [Bailinhaonella thermotolerans]|uniref:Putative hydro-lyase n=1 Tax=Bailinhaonella thermotolerans TaxID=1070861 RepID=A0A3A4B858_9ACTN|nr:putative hydro-lyase [Bailinhaonella thermotolerans]RJL34421.1 putative hydro-lyase [Bailinhaonella thermotolerans]